MISHTLAEIAEAVGGTLHDADRGTQVSGPVVADSRSVVPGALFVADGRGHEYADDAVGRGAVAVLCGRQLPGVPRIVAPPAPEYDVDASVVALGRFSRAYVRRLADTTIVGITGSSGKTGTKDLAAQVLAAAGPTVASEESLNNELGVPLTVLRADASTRFLVLEMGARAVGDLTYVTGVAPPDIGVVLNVGLAHVGEFGGKERVARAKGELVEALTVDGVAVLNADDDLVRAMAARAPGRVVLTGESADADVRAEDVRLDTGGHARFRLVDTTGSADVRLDLVGRHHVANALAVAAVGRIAGLSVAEVADALSSARRQARWRMEVTERPDGVTVVNDGYNANPESMRAALRTLVDLAGGRRTWAVLGEMLELGAASHPEHAEIGTLAVRLGVTRLVVVGEGARPIHQAASNAGQQEAVSELVSDVDEALELLRRELAPGDVILVKSSRDAGLRHLGDLLLTEEAAAW